MLLYMGVVGIGVLYVAWVLCGVLKTVFLPCYSHVKTRDIIFKLLFYFACSYFQ